MPRTYNNGRFTATASSDSRLGLRSSESNNDFGPEALRILGILRPLRLQNKSNANPTRNSRTAPPTTPRRNIAGLVLATGKWL